MKIIVNNLNGNINALKNYISNVSNDINKIKNIIDSSIPAAWQGDDATSFRIEYNKILNSLMEYKSSLNDYLTFLSGVQKCFDILEEAYNKQIT